MVVKAVDIEKLADAIPASAVIASVEALCYHRQFLDEQQDGYGENVLERLQTGRQHEAIDLAEAFFRRRKIGRVLAEVFEEVDCLVGATIPCLPPAVGSSSIDVSGRGEGIVDALVRNERSSERRWSPRTLLALRSLGCEHPAFPAADCRQRKGSVAFASGPLLPVRN